VYGYRSENLLMQWIRSDLLIRQAYGTMIETGK
jgi:hypothetical protein